jgi:purine-binding chemotaxis protein CheW
LPTTSTHASSSEAGKEHRSPARAQIPDWVLFTVDEGRYALPLNAVERIVAAAEVTALPGAPAAIRGAANVAGEILPVFDLRYRFSPPARPIIPADHFLIVRAAGRRAILLIDSAGGILKGVPDTLVEAHRVAPTPPHIAGIIVADDGLVLIHDVDAFLSANESRELDAALASGALHAG